MKATAASRKQKESAAEPSPRSWRVAAAILALLVFLPPDTTAQKLPQPLTLPRPTAESGGVPTVAATPSLPIVPGELGLSEGRWAPPDTDEAIPLVAPDIPCSLPRSEEHTSELQSRLHLVCRLLLEKKKAKSAIAYFVVYAADNDAER